MNRRNIIAALLSGTSMLAVASVANAQSASTQTAQAAQAAPVEEVIVTGTRIVRDGYEAPTPTTIVAAEALEATTPTDLPDALNKLPMFSGSRTMQGANNGGGVNNPGNFLNLRDFGINRTLILLDGQRVPPTNFDGTVDTNTIPQILVQRVDVVTGGASAVYGSDAVTGVVNFVLDHSFTGVKGTVQGGESNYGDNNTWRVDLAAGFNLTDKIHFMAGVSHNQEDGVRYKEDRPNGDSVWCMTGAGTTAKPYVVTPNCRLATASYGGLITTGPFAGQAFNPNQTLFTFNPGTTTNTSGTDSGGDGIYWNHTTLISPLNTTQTFGRIDYDINDDLKMYIQGGWSQSLTHFQNTLENRSASSVNKLTIYADNAFLPTSIANTLAADNVSSFTLSRYSEDFGRARVFIDTSSNNESLGFEGKVFNTWKWTASYIHGEGDLYEPTVGNTNNPNFYAAVDAVKNSSGQIVCRVSTTANASLYPGCVPIDVFGENNFSQAAASYVEGTTWWSAVNKTDDINLNLAGNLFSNWAGPVSVALSGEYRHASLRETTNADPNTPVVFTGLQGGFSSSTPEWVKNINAPAFGQDWVAEGAAEVVFPLLVGMPFAKNLEFDGAIRFTHYSVSGSVDTWKAGLNYEPTDSLRFRLVESRDIRAPTLYDLYAGRNLSQSSFSDPLTGGVGQPTLISQGNPNLVPEIGYTSTAGIIYSPEWLPRATLSLDVFNIKISNAITSLGGSAAQPQVNDCTASGGTSPECSLFVRPLGNTNTSAANYPTIIYSESLNVAYTRTYGMDLDASYKFDLNLSKDLQGSMTLRDLMTYQPHLITKTTPTSVNVESAGVATIPRVKNTVMLDYEAGPWGIDIENRFQGATKVNGNPSLVYVSTRGVSAGDYTDLTINYTFHALYAKNLQLFLSVTNVFNQGALWVPPTPGVAGTPAFTFEGTGDVIGRMFIAGVHFKY